MKSRYTPLWALLIGIAVFVVDLLSKFYIQEYLPRMSRAFPAYPYGGIGVFKDFFGIEFSLTHHINKGAAWGILSDWQQALLLFRIALVIGLVIYVVFLNKKREWDIPFALIIAGAAGNVLDYFLYGHVIDMFHFVFWGYDYPVFNVADCAIFIGIAWLIIGSYREK